MTKINFLLSIIIFSIISSYATNISEPEINEALVKKLFSGDLKPMKQHALDLIATDPDSAVIYLSAIVTRYDDNMNESDKKLVIGSLNNLGYIYFYEYENIIKSYQYLTKALQLSEKTGIDSSFPYIYLNMANIDNVVEDNENAMQNFKKAFRTSVNQKAYDMTLVSLIGMLNFAHIALNQNLKDYKYEITTYKSLHIPDSIPLKRFTSLYLKGIELTQNRQYDRAIECFRQAIDNINTVYTPERYKYVVLNSIAKAKKLKGDVVGAIGSLKQILSIADGDDIRGAVYNQLNLLYREIGINDSADMYKARYLELTDSLLHHGQAQAIRSIGARYVEDKLNERIAQSAREKKQLTIIAVISTSALLIIILLAVWMLLQRKKLRNANKTIFEKSRENLDLQPNINASDIGQPNISDAYSLTPDNSGECEINDTIIEKSSASPSVETVKISESDSEAKSLAEKLREILLNSPEVYSPDFSVERLAMLAEVPTKKVSRCLNETMKTNFIAELQRARVREACRRMEDERAYGNITIEALANELGFKSRSNFAIVFKKITGLNPSEYLKFSRKEKKQ